MAPTKTIMSSIDMVSLNFEPTRLKITKILPDELIVHVDNIMTFGKNIQTFFDKLAYKYNYKLKAVLVTPVYHLGGDFFHDKEKTLLAWGATSYIKKMLKYYELKFNEKSK